MYNRSRNQWKIAKFFVNNSIYLIMIAVFGAIILCLLQWIIKLQSLTFYYNQPDRIGGILNGDWVANIGY
jgi:hypothetical protein